MEKTSRNVVIKIILDFIFFAIPALIALILNLFVSPFERGFFCNDESLIHPFKPDTITTLTLSITGLVVSAITIITIEIIRAKKKSDYWDNSTLVILNRNVPLVVRKMFQYIGILLFAASINQFLTDMTKFVVGRYRPHFIDVCQPRILPEGSTCDDVQNWHKYIQNFECTNPNTTDRMLVDMRLSFPSGHTSFAFTIAVFCVLYIQARITWRRSNLMKHFIQLLYVTAATYTALSRISDYMHHWSDVLAGFILGSGISVVFAFYLTDLFKSNSKGGVEGEKASHDV